MWLALVLTACGRIPEDASGIEIYLQACARCHGAELEGRIGPALGAGSDVADQPDQYYVTTITRGKGRMPSFRATLTEEQIERVIAFVRSRQIGR